MNHFHTTEPVFDLNNSDIQELQRICKNTSDNPAVLKDTVYLSLTLPGSFQTLIYYTSSWGQEFASHEVQISSEFTFQNTKGRCSAECAPFFTLAGEDRSVDFAICTSGNYKVYIQHRNCTTTLIITNPDPSFQTTLPSGKTYAFPQILAHVFHTMAESYRTKQEYAFQTLTDHEVYHKLPVIYNHWWAYEDRHINEELILRNAEIAHEIGVEMLVLDAGWFGNDSPTEEWFTVRGDWDHVNHIRFPHGLTWLKEQIEGMGLRFGIWCELEGLGLQSDLLRSHPEYSAIRDGQNLGYLCFSSPQVQEWAYQTMVSLFRQCGSTYWKLDFNLDPGLGCNATGHCHGSGDGLQKHYEGLYQVLDRLQKEFPDLIIENCSSGGQRLNLEMGRHTHIHFLSDPDYSTHQMHQFKEASKWFLPRQLLHFMWSNTVTTNGGSPFPSLDLNALTPGEIRYHMRLAMMHQFGISHRLPEYTNHTLALMKDNLKLYREIIRPFVANGVYLPLYLSEHMNVFSFTKNGDSLLLLFAEEPGTVSFDLSPLLPTDKASCMYELTDLDTNTTTTLNFPEDSLIPFTSQENWTSRLLLLHTGLLTD